jgi:hypothetical protein
MDVQHAIAAEADADLILHRFDVDVAGLGLHGVQKQCVHQFDDPAGVVGLDRRLHLPLGMAFVGFEDFLDGALAGDQRHDFRAEQSFGILTDAQVERIGERDQRLTVFDPDGQQIALQTPVRISLVEQFSIHIAQFERDLRKAELVGQNLDQLVFSDKVIFQQDVAQLFGVSGVFLLLLQGERRAQILFPQVSQFHQQRADANRHPMLVQGVALLLRTHVANLVENAQQGLIHG